MLPLVILSRWVFSPSKMESFHCQCCWLLFFGCFGVFLIAHKCDHSFGLLLTSKLLCWAIILSTHTPPWKPDSGLVLCSINDAIDGNRFCSDTTPILTLLADGGPPVKLCPGSLYDGAALIVPEDGSTHGIWRPPRCGHLWSGCCLCHNRLAEEAYPQSIPPDGKKYWEWKESPKVRLSSRGDSAPPRAGATAPPRSWQDPPNCTDRSSGCGSPVDCFILRFLRHSSSQMSETAPSDRCFPS